MHTYSDNILLIAGGAQNEPPYIACITQCPGSDVGCSQLCSVNRFHKGGFCVASKCCCNGPGI